MIYFLINNNFHLDLDFSLAKQLHSEELGLIQVPYSLNIIRKNPLFKKILCFDHRVHISLKRFLFHPLELKKISGIIDSELNVRNNDILLVHSETDILVHFIIQKFYDNKARVYLLEDGTFTMCTYNLMPEKPGLKELTKLFILRTLYNLRYTDIRKFGPHVLPVMKDFVYEGVIVNFGKSLKRNIPVIRLTQVKEQFEILYEDGAIFFSQGLYFWYLSENEYVDLIDELLIVSKKFGRFFFKFHPSESESVKDSLSALITNKYPWVTIITENDIAENIIIRYPVKYAITFNSTAALNLIKKGLVPIYMNSILFDKHPDSTLHAFSLFLKAIDCHVPGSVSEIEPGFSAFSVPFSDVGTKTISEILL
jgi:hypothetical protein